MFKRKSVLFAWGISYAALLLLLVLFGFTLKLNAQAKMLEEYKNITQSLQHQANQSIAEYFSAMEKRAYNLANDYVINSFASLGDPYGAPYYNLVPIQRTFKFECLSSQEEIEIYLYCKNINRALSSKTIAEPKFFYAALQGNEKYDESFFANLINCFHFNELAVIEHENAQENNVLMLTSVPLTQSNPNATIVQALSNSALRKVLEQRLPLTNSTSALLDQNGKIVCITGNEMLVDVLSATDLSNMQISEIQLDSKSYWIQQDIMNQTGWKIVTVLPMSELTQKTAWIGKLMVMLMLLFLSIGIICVCLLLWLNYAPLRQLREWYPKGTMQGNEYSNIKYALKNMRNDLERMGALQTKQAAYMQEEFLSSCLDRELEIDETRIQQLFAQMKVKFVGDWFAVIILEFLAGEERNIQLERDTFFRNFKETSGNDFAAFWVSNKQNDVLILNFNDNRCGKSICSIVTKSLSAIDKNENLGLIVCTSNLYKGLGQIYFAHLDASEMLMQKKFALDKNNNFNIECDKYTLRASIQFSQEQKDLLMRYVKAKNLCEAQKLLNIVYARNFKDESLPLSVCKCLAEDILTGILRMFDFDARFYQSIEEPFSAKIIQCCVLSSRQGIAQFIDNYVAEAVALWNSYTEKKPTERIALFDRVTDYTMEHYLEHDFNVSAIANALEVNVAYLSKYFKERTGIGLLNYINGLRINYAKELMAREHITVTQAADRAGFDNPNTFIRLFKKYEGTTPGCFYNF